MGKALAFLLLIHLNVAASQPPPVIDSDFYFAQKDESLFFVVERVGDKNIDTWQSYVRLQKGAQMRVGNDIHADWRRTNELDDKKANVVWSAKDPLEKMEKILREFGEGAYQPPPEVWIAYATNKKPDVPFKLGKYKDIEADFKLRAIELDKIADIEMAVTVVAQKGVPFQLHAGIARGMVAREKNREPHKGISTKLHAYAALIMKRRNPKTLYLITTPLPKMREILIDALPKKAILEDAITRNGNPFFDKSASWTLRNERKKVVFETNRSDAIGKYRWFFVNTQPEERFPYVVVKLKDLAAAF